MNGSRRVWHVVGLGVVAMLMGLMLIGPERVDPILTDLLGLEAPKSVLEEPVPRADEVSARVFDAVTESDVRDLMARFTRHGSRVVGYPGHDAAADFIESEFRRLGLSDVETESYGVASPKD